MKYYILSIQVIQPGKGVVIGAGEDRAIYLCSSPKDAAIAAYQKTGNVLKAGLDAKVKLFSLDLDKLVVKEEKRLLLEFKEE